MVRIFKNQEALANNSQLLCLFSLSHCHEKVQLLRALYIAILILRKGRTLSISKVFIIFILLAEKEIASQILKTKSTYIKLK